MRTEKRLAKSFAQINDFFIEDLVGPVTCNLLKTKTFIYIVKQNMEFFCEQDLADFQDNESTHKSRVGNFLGVGYYYNFFWEE